MYIPNSMDSKALCHSKDLQKPHIRHRCSQTWQSNRVFRLGPYTTFVEHRLRALGALEYQHLEVVHHTKKTSNLTKFQVVLFLWPLVFSLHRSIATFHTLHTTASFQHFSHAEHSDRKVDFFPYMAWPS